MSRISLDTREACTNGGVRLTRRVDFGRSCHDDESRHPDVRVVITPPTRDSGPKGQEARRGLVEESGGETSRHIIKYIGQQVQCGAATALVQS
ncbi:uncharacterized protein TNIN_144721 [Trichonephila inaurata madagascariensis]|uniref:Uncharacterized protein n=1 Tax=Trichonephila inaurata madagascariensis TaxID=2747483 RepID=A0A8X6Y0Z6_9ARAC|nr:uncharacterized protein TNIN_144721 [Trichonephila inaurata madagascariensis]